MTMKITVTFPVKVIKEVDGKETLSDMNATFDIHPKVDGEPIEDYVAFEFGEEVIFFNKQDLKEFTDFFKIKKSTRKNDGRKKKSKKEIKEENDN
jgi:hypothetical protein